MSKRIKDMKNFFESQGKGKIVMPQSMATPKMK